MSRSGLRSSGEILLKLSIVLVLPLLGSTASLASYGLLALWALRGPRAAIEALTLCWFLNHGNPALYASAPGGELLRWVVMLAAFTSVALATLRSGFRVPPSWTWLVIFCVGAALLSAQGEYASLSFLRLTIFVIGASSLLLGFHLTRDQYAYWQRWFLTCFAAVTVLGLPLIVHEFGYVRNGHGFQGLLNQPQAYGVFLAPFTAWLIALRLGGRLRGRAPWLLVVLASISLVATESRTAAFAALLGLAAALVWIYLCRPSHLPFTRSALLRSLPVVGVLACLLMLRAGPILEGVEGFIQKYPKQGPLAPSMSDKLLESRNHLLVASLENFLEHPVAGIGFGVPTHSFVVKRDPFLGLPVSVVGEEESVEKSTNFVVVLEEVGLVGFLLFLAMLLSLLRPAFTRRGGGAPVALGTCAVLLTFGEAIFFTTGGTGVLIWLCIGVARLSEAEAV